MKTVRILISSPGDVARERELARQVVADLQRRYAGNLLLQPVLWEDLLLQADVPFQKGIDAVLSGDRGIDIALFILWSRLGSHNPCFGEANRTRGIRNRQSGCKLLFLTQGFLLAEAGPIR